MLFWIGNSEYGNTYALNKFTDRSLSDNDFLEYDGFVFLFGDIDSTMTDIKTGKIW